LVALLAVVGLLAAPSVTPVAAQDAEAPICEARTRHRRTGTNGPRRRRVHDRVHGSRHDLHRLRRRQHHDRRVLRRINGGRHQGQWGRHRRGGRSDLHVRLQL